MRRGAEALPYIPPLLGGRVCLGQLEELIGRVAYETLGFLVGVRHCLSRRLGVQICPAFVLDVAHDLGVKAGAPRGRRLGSRSSGAGGLAGGGGAGAIGPNLARMPRST